MRTVRYGMTCLGALAISLAGLSTAAVHAAPTWAPAATAPIHPGVQLDSPAGQCTANFVFTNPQGAVFIGQAAHCTSTGGQTDTGGCTTGSLPIGTLVTIQGASKPGVMVYNSWLAMQAAHETDMNACAFNDLALVKIDPADVGKVNPSIPTWGGPVGGFSPGTTRGQRVYSYGNSSLRMGLTLLSPKTGLSLGDGFGGWTRDVYTVTPGIPGDSGSAFLDASGRALGVLSTIQFYPRVAANGVGDIGREVAYMLGHDGPQVQLAPGTEPFSPNKLPLGI